MQLDGLNAQNGSLKALLGCLRPAAREVGPKLEALLHVKEEMGGGGSGEIPAEEAESKAAEALVAAGNRIGPAVEHLVTMAVNRQS